MNRQTWELLNRCKFSERARCIPIHIRVKKWLFIVILAANHLNWNDRQNDTELPSLSICCNLWLIFLSCYGVYGWKSFFLKCLDARHISLINHSCKTFLSEMHRTRHRSLRWFETGSVCLNKCRRFFS